jgi:hypothetical protein
MVFFRNIYNAGVGGEGQFQVRLAKNTISGAQFIEFRIFKGSGTVNGGAITTAGYGAAANKGWNITNSTAFTNTFGDTFATTFPADNTSFVISSDSSGNTWSFTNTSYLNI